MTDATYAGLIILEVDGKEVEVISVNPSTNTGRQGVKTMNSLGEVKGYKDGITTHSLSITAAVPTDGTEIEWETITNAKLTIYPLGKSDKRTSYLGCFSTECSEQYDVESEARIDVTLEALRKIKE